MGINNTRNELGRVISYIFVIITMNIILNSTELAIYASPGYFSLNDININLIGHKK